MRRTKDYKILVEFLVEQELGKTEVTEQIVFPNKETVIAYLKNHLKEKRYSRITTSHKNVLMDIAVYGQFQERPSYWIQVKRVEYIDSV